MIVAVAAMVAGAVALLVPPQRRLATVDGPAPSTSGPGDPGDDDSLLRRGRWLWAALAGAGAAVVVGGSLAVPAGLVLAVVVHRAAGRIEPPSVRRRREDVRHDLPHVVTLLAAALRSGAGVPVALEAVRAALPGAASDRLAGISARLHLGGDPLVAWDTVAADPQLRALGQALGRAHRTGAPVVATLEALAEDLAEQARGEAEDRARAVGVRAAVPLGVCLLPAFLLLGIVPLAVSLASGVVTTAR